MMIKFIAFLILLLTCVTSGIHHHKHKHHAHKASKKTTRQQKELNLRGGSGSKLVYKVKPSDIVRKKLVTTTTTSFPLDAFVRICVPREINRGTEPNGDISIALKDKKFCRQMASKFPKEVNQLIRLRAEPVYTPKRSLRMEGKSEAHQQITKKKKQMRFMEAPFLTIRSEPVKCILNDVIKTERDAKQCSFYVNAGSCNGKSAEKIRKQCGDCCDLGDKAEPIPKTEGFSLTATTDFFNLKQQAFDEAVVYYQLPTAPTPDEIHQFMLKFIKEYDDENKPWYQAFRSKKAIATYSRDRVIAYLKAEDAYIVKNWPLIDITTAHDCQHRRLWAAIEALRVRFLEAIHIWERRTCIRFREAKTTSEKKDSYRITVVRNEASTNPNNHVMKLDLYAPVGTITHELGHTFSLLHEQQRQDTPKYIKLLDPVKNDDQWKIEDKRFSIEFKDTTYDFGSIMHYPQSVDYDVSDKTKPTMKTKLFDVKDPLDKGVKKPLECKMPSTGEPCFMHVYEKGGNAYSQFSPQVSEMHNHDVKSICEANDCINKIKQCGEVETFKQCHHCCAVMTLRENIDRLKENARVDAVPFTSKTKVNIVAGQRDMPDKQDYYIVNRLFRCKPRKDDNKCHKERVISQHASDDKEQYCITPGRQGDFCYEDDTNTCATGLKCVDFTCQ